jgi:hypothetical protein
MGAKGTKPQPLSVIANRLFRIALQALVKMSIGLGVKMLEFLVDWHL